MLGYIQWKKEVNRMAKVEFTGRSASYIFENAGGMRDQLEQTILNELQEKDIL